MNFLPRFCPFLLSLSLRSYLLEALIDATLAEVL